MPNKRVEQAPERKLPTICSVPHNYQQDDLEWASSMPCTVFLTHDLHSPSVNNIMKQQEVTPTAPLLCVLGKMESRLCMTSPLPVPWRSHFSQGGDVQ